MAPLLNLQKASKELNQYVKKRKGKPFADPRASISVKLLNGHKVIWQERIPNIVHTDGDVHASTLVAVTQGSRPRYETHQEEVVLNSALDNLDGGSCTEMFSEAQDERDEKPVPVSYWVDK
ncbi:hypothetical protein M422DRAFT_45199 [Sphaerobolus stellatus SS14]|nr:hypothetical protein M422DRAFT_45199 [Sphaerobolus stellatus SS14]